MKKRRLLGLLIVSILLISSISLVSAGLLGDIWNKITGKAIEECTDNLDCPEQMKCENFGCVDVGCVEEGQRTPITAISPEGFEQRKHMATECCGGFIAITYSGDFDADCNIELIEGTQGGAVCSNCGNGICEGWETECNCPNDCGEEPEPEPETCAAEISINFDKSNYVVGEQFEAEMGVFDSQGNPIPNYPFYVKMYDDRWHTPGQERTGADGYVKRTGTVEKLPGGMTKAIFNAYTEETSSCSKVEDTTEIEVEPGPEPEPIPPGPEPRPEPRVCAKQIRINANKEIYYYGDHFEITIAVFDAQGNPLPDYSFFFQTYTYHPDGMWHTPEERITGRDGDDKMGGTIERGKQQAGKTKLKVYTQEYSKCDSVEDIIEVEIKGGEKREEVCGIGTCVPEEEEVEEIPEGEVLYSCSGCELEGKCYPMGYRKAGQYCSENYEFVEQLDEAVCDNSFECKSNMCVSGECVGEGLLRKIIKWFKKMFGGDEEPEEPGEEICRKLLIKKDIGDYEYGESFYGDIKETQVPVYSEDGEQIDIVKCCAASYLYQGETGAMGLVCPFDNREDVKNSLEWLLIKNTNLGLSEYKGENVLKDSNRAIVWTSNAYIVASGGDPSRGTPLAEDIVDAYLKKYKNDLEDIEIPPRPPPEHHDPTEEFLRDIEGLGTLTLIDFEALSDGTILQADEKLTGKEWESLGVTFEAPSEEYLKVFGPWYPFNPLDKLSLSPGFGPFEGGSDTHDDLNIIFTEPVKAAGIYLLDLGETDERESITFLDGNNNVIEKISPWPKSTFGNPAPGTFVSLIHDGISKIEILENTQDGDDIAYDNLYFVK